MPKKSTNKSTQITLRSNEVYSSILVEKGDTVLVPLPKEIVSKLKLKDTKEPIFWTINGGAIEIHGKTPTIKIPALKLDIDEFIKQV